jgi:hypothetical protein
MTRRFSSAVASLCTNRARRTGRRWAPRLLAGVAGLAVGAACAATVQRSERSTSSLRPVAPVPVGRAKAAAVPEPRDRVLLVWTPGRLPEGLGERVSSLPGVVRTTTVHGGLVGMTRSWGADGVVVDEPRPGFAIPLDGMAFDPATIGPFLPATVRPVFERLGADEVLLGTTSARLRRLQPGGSLELSGGRRVTVAGVVDDAVIGAAEVAFIRAGASAELPLPRYLLVHYDRDRTATEAAIRGVVAPEVPVRFRGPGETPFFRQGDAVLAQVFIKERFGEFSFRDLEGAAIEVDPEWERANLVSRNHPVLGRLRCHKDLLPALDGVLRELARQNLEFIITSFEGCWNPSRIVEGGDLSRHAWGAAVDLNYAKNPTQLVSAQDPRLVEAMARWGFTWGGNWLVPDPAHFEYLRLPPA